MSVISMLALFFTISMVYVPPLNAASVGICDHGFFNFTNVPM